MRYAKLINNFPVYAPNPIIIGDRQIANPPAEVYTEQGYKPVRYTNPPVVDEGFVAVAVWVETEVEIVQTWEQVEKTEYDGDEAMDFIFGGEN